VSVNLPADAVPLDGNENRLNGAAGGFCLDRPGRRPAGRGPGRRGAAAGL